jgi:hypothetical protein
MNEPRIPSLVDKSISPKAREFLAKVTDFVENECENSRNTLKI